MRNPFRFLPAILLIFSSILPRDGLAGDDPMDQIPDLLNSILEVEKTNKIIPWQNSATGNAGKITITKTYVLGKDTNCRDYTRTVKKPDGEETEVMGTGCRDQNGKWSLEEGAPVSKKAVKHAAGEATPGPLDSKVSAGDNPPAKMDKSSPPPVKESAPALPPGKKAEAAAVTVKDPEYLGGSIPSKSDEY